MITVRTTSRCPFQDETVVVMIYGVVPARRPRASHPHHDARRNHAVVAGAPPRVATSEAPGNLHHRARPPVPPRPANNEPRRLLLSAQRLLVAVCRCCTSAAGARS